MVKRLNAEQTHWRATVYPEYDRMSIRDMLARAGSARKTLPKLPQSWKKSLLNQNSVMQDDMELPKEWDWRNVSGVNYDSPVRHQQACGSCYVFATVSAIESRIRIATKNKVQVQLAPQEIVSCR